MFSIFALPNSVALLLILWDPCVCRASSAHLCCPSVFLVSFLPFSINFFIFKNFLLFTLLYNFLQSMICCVYSLFVFFSELFSNFFLSSVTSNFELCCPLTYSCLSQKAGLFVDRSFWCSFIDCRHVSLLLTLFFLLIIVYGIQP